MEDTISNAIESDEILEFEYEDHHREVKPFKLFKSKDGRTFIEAVQVMGDSESGEQPFWRTFELEKIDSINETKGPDNVHDSEHILADAEGMYNPDDDRYEEIICARDGYE